MVYISGSDHENILIWHCRHFSWNHLKSSCCSRMKFLLIGLVQRQLVKSRRQKQTRRAEHLQKWSPLLWLSHSIWKGITVEHKGTGNWNDNTRNKRIAALATWFQLACQWPQLWFEAEIFSRFRSKIWFTGSLDSFLIPSLISSMQRMTTLSQGCFHTHWLSN